MKDKKNARKSYIAYQTKKIGELLGDCNYALAKKIIYELLKDYPDDPILLRKLAKVYISENNYEDAIGILEKIDEEKIFKRLTALYIKVGNEEKMFEMYMKYYKDRYIYEDTCILGEFKNRSSYSSIRTFLKYKYEPLILNESTPYSHMQMCKYDTDLAFKHIMEGHSKDSENHKTKFRDEIDIESLYKKIQEHVKKHSEDSTIHENSSEVFYIYLPDCGYEDGNDKRYDYVRVITTLKDNNIITMYPSNVYKQKVSYFDVDTGEKSKVKVKSGLDRFNSRYNK